MSLNGVMQIKIMAPWQKVTNNATGDILIITLLTYVESRETLTIKKIRSIQPINISFKCIGQYNY
jgi:hypothetical protein